MTSRDRSAEAIMRAPESGDFDDVGALVTAMRHMLDDAGAIPAFDSRQLYVLAVMAETAWRRLDDAMQAGGK